jgi:multicomponent Na+:H+ antiporter subunit G
MTTVASILMLAGGAVAILAGVGIFRLQTPYARFHAAGKASPIAFLIAAIGAGLELGPAGAAHLTIAGLAMVLTLPFGVHLLFRAVHRTQPKYNPTPDELALAEADRNFP